MDEVEIERPKNPDNWFCRIFWPSARGVNWTVAFGCCVCLAIGAYNSYGDFSRHQTQVGLFDVLLYFVGSAAILRRSFAAALLVWFWLVLGQAGNLLMGLSLMPISTTAIVLLLGTLRACWIAARSKGLLARPHRRFIESLSQTIWNLGRPIFFLAAVPMVLACLYGTVEGIHDHGLQRVESLEIDRPAKVEPTR